MEEIKGLMGDFKEYIDAVEIQSQKASLLKDRISNMKQRESPSTTPQGHPGSNTRILGHSSRDSSASAHSSFADLDDPSINPWSSDSTGTSIGCI
jgi:hypothetical protein